MPKKFAVSTKSCQMFLTKVVREKVRLVIPMITPAFVLIGGGRAFTESEIVSLAAQPAITVTVNSGSQNDGKMYSDNWKLDSNNSWEYYENGNKVSNAWVHDHGQWYLLGDDGKMRTGLYESYGKYYLLDDVRGTGTYGKLLKNGGYYKGVKITADTSGDYEGALSNETLNSLSAVGITKDKAVGVTGTQHAGQVANKTKDNNPFNIANYSGYETVRPKSRYRLGLTDNRHGKQMVVGIVENNHLYAIGTDGKKYQADTASMSGRARYWNSAEEFMASDWAKYLDTGKQAPDGRIYNTITHARDTMEDGCGIASRSVTIQDGTYRSLEEDNPTITQDVLHYFYTTSYHWSQDPQAL